jgi:hypothetical protein
MRRCTRILARGTVREGSIDHAAQGCKNKPRNNTSWSSWGVNLSTQKSRHKGLPLKAQLPLTPFLYIFSEAEMNVVGCVGSS